MNAREPMDVMLEDVSPRMRVVFGVLLTQRYAGTLLEEILEVLGPPTPHPWEGSNRKVTREEQLRRDRLVGAQRQERWRLAMRFLSTFAGRILAMPDENAIKRVVHEAGIYLDVVDHGKTPQSVANKRRLDLEVVQKIVDEVGRVLAPLDEKAKRHG